MLKLVCLEIEKRWEILLRLAGMIRTPTRYPDDGNRVRHGYRLFGRRRYLAIAIQFVIFRKEKVAAKNHLKPVSVAGIQKTYLQREISLIIKRERLQLARIQERSGNISGAVTRGKALFRAVASGHRNAPSCHEVGIRKWVSALQI
jgi:hypothetical protein